MTPGPTIIRKCSVCGKLIAQRTIASGNTCGARFWTDGKREAPMLPERLWLVKCQHCGAVVWIDEQDEVGEVVPWGAADAKFDGALPYEHPSFADYLAVLGSVLSDSRKQRYLRLSAWWAGNDTRRRVNGASALNADEAANLRAFMALLDDSDENDRLTKAEALRELGEYPKSLELLSGPFREGLARSASIVRDLVTQRTPLVKEMDLGS